MEVVRYVNGQRLAGELPKMEVGNPGLRELLRELYLRALRGEAAEERRGTGA